MGEVIEFPQPGGTEVLHFDEKHAFGEIGGLMLSLAQEQNKEDSPLILVMLGAPVVFTHWRPSSRPRKDQTSLRWLAISCCAVLPSPMATGPNSLIDMERGA
jgi:hypothetical protein